MEIGGFKLAEIGWIMLFALVLLFLVYHFAPARKFVTGATS